jgi:hypothetical protein
MRSQDEGTKWITMVTGSKCTGKVWDSDHVVDTQTTRTLPKADMGM